MTCRSAREVDLPEGELKGGKHGKHGDAELSIGGEVDLPEGELDSREASTTTSTAKLTCRSAARSICPKASSREASTAMPSARGATAMLTCRSAARSTCTKASTPSVASAAASGLAICRSGWVGGKGGEHGDADVHGGAHGDADVSLGGEVDVHKMSTPSVASAAASGLAVCRSGLGSAARDASTVMPTCTVAQARRC